jgi:uncharacterized protein
MLILVVLYPVIMMQSLYLVDYFSFLESALKTFIENVICVSLLAWSLLPMVIYLLKWWLNVRFNSAKNLLGVGILLLVYAIEIFAFLG